MRGQGFVVHVLLHCYYNEVFVHLIAYNFFSTWFMCNFPGGFFLFFFLKQFLLHGIILTPAWFTSMLEPLDPQHKSLLFELTYLAVFCTVFVKDTWG